MYKVKYHNISDNKNLEDFINKQYMLGYELISISSREIGGVLIFKKILQ